MPDRYEIEVGLNAGSMRRARASMDSTLGSKFWKESYKRADVELKKHLRSMGVQSDRAADRLSKNFSSLFGKAAKSFGGDLAQAAKEGSDAYVGAMKKAVDRISRIQAKSDQEREDAVGKIIQEELKGLDDRLKGEKKIARERARAAKSGARGGGGGAGVGGVADIAGAAARAGGGGGGAVGKTLAKVAGGMGGGGGMAGMLASVTRLGAAAGPVGAALAALGATALAVGKKLLEVQQSIKRLNQSMLSNVGASDLMASGNLSVTEGVTALRREFMTSFEVNRKWRMSAEEGYQAMNALTMAGVSLDKVMRQTGRDVGSAARQMSETTMAYSSVFAVSTGEIGQVVGEMMTNLSYSFDEARGALAQIDTAAQKSGISASVFFSKIQSVNSQLGMMNSNLGFQAKLVAKLARGGLGFEDATQAATTFMGKIDEESARTMFAFLSAQEGGVEAFVTREIERLEAELAATDDPARQRRLEYGIRQWKQVMDGGTADIALAAQTMSMSLGTGAGEMEARMRSVAQALGKEFETLTSADLDQALTLEDTEMLKKLGFMGSTTEEIAKGILAMQDIISGHGSAADAIDDMQRQSLRPQQEAIAEDIRLAMEMRQNTEDIAKILTNMKEWLFSKLYDILLAIYEMLVQGFGDQADLTVLGFDKALRQNMKDQETLAMQIAEETDPAKREELTAELEALQAQADAMAARREEISKMSDTKFAETFGAGAKAADILKAEVGDDTGRGILTGGGGTFVGGRETDVAKHGTTADRMEDLAPSTVAGHQREEGAQEFLKRMGYPTKDAFWTKLREIEGSYGAAETMYEDYQRRIGAGADDRDARGMLKYVSMWEDYYRPHLGDQFISEMPRFAEGGIVTRPTVALLGEEGPEAVVPLGGGAGRGGLVVNIYGGIYDLEVLKRKLQEAFQQYERSQRI